MVSWSAPAERTGDDAVGRPRHPTTRLMPTVRSFSKNSAAVYLVKPTVNTGMVSVGVGFRPVGVLARQTRVGGLLTPWLQPGEKRHRSHFNRFNGFLGAAGSRPTTGTDPRARRGIRPPSATSYTNYERENRIPPRRQGRNYRPNPWELDSRRPIPTGRTV